MRDEQHDWKVLSSDNDLQKFYSIAVRNCYEVLCHENQSATEKYQHLIDANNKTADELIPIKKKKVKISANKRIKEETPSK